MCEILFRGKREDTGDWVIGGSIVKEINNIGQAEYFMPQRGENNVVSLDANENITGFEKCHFYIKYY